MAQNCEDLQNFVLKCKTRLQKLLEQLDWTEEGVLQNFNSNSVASTNFQKAKKICPPLKSTYPESCITKNSVSIETPQLQQLLNNNEIEAPQNFRDLQANFSREEKLKIYEHVINHTEKLENNTVAKVADGEISLAEIVAQKKREEKQKKRKFRKSKPTHIEEVRSLVDLQMQALLQFMGNQCVKVEKQKKDKKLDFNQTKQSHSRDHHRTYKERIIDSKTHYRNSYKERYSEFKRRSRSQSKERTKESRRRSSHSKESRYRSRSRSYERSYNSRKSGKERVDKSYKRRSRSNDRSKDSQRRNRSRSKERSYKSRKSSKERIKESKRRSRSYSHDDHYKRKRSKERNKDYHRQSSTNNQPESYKEYHRQSSTNNQPESYHKKRRSRSPKTEYGMNNDVNRKISHRTSSREDHYNEKSHCRKSHNKT